jgi:hypothetical protein
LTEEDGAGTVELDDDPNDNQYRQQNDETKRRSEDVQRTFQRHRPPRGRDQGEAIVIGSHGASAQGIAHDGGDAIDLRISHVGEQWQRDCPSKIAAGDRELIGLAATTLFPVEHLVQRPIMD